MKRGLILSLLFVPLIGCKEPPPQKDYPFKGQVLGVRKDVREVRLAHEDIDGLMPAMTMSFAVRDVRLLDGLEPGDLVQGTLVVVDTDAWLSEVHRVGHAAIPEETIAAEAQSGPASAPIDLLEPGEPVPDASFTDQSHQPFSFANTRGKAVALTFTYTRCPLPTFCPLLDRHFKVVQQLVARRADLKGKTQLLTISFDPAFDTPDVLGRHAAALDADLASWRFLTADKVTTEDFATRFGVSIVPDAGGTITHNMRTAVVGPDGRLRKIFNGGDWTPDDLVNELAAALVS
ncbi:MAG: SCO family protein [Vicinamibacterales bacterium]